MFSALFWGSNLNAKDLQFDNIQQIEVLNSEYDDFAPCYDRYRQVLYFNSVRDKYSYFYQSKLDNSTYTEPVMLKGDINQPFKHQSYLSILNEDQAVYTAYSLKSDRSYMNLFNLYYKKGLWSKPILLDGLAGANYSAQATVNTEANYLAFSSIRNAEDSDTDIWLAYRLDDGSWGDLMPITAINSRGDEITLFLKSPDTLYFASNGLGGPGGFDLYRTVKVDGIWQRPFPLIDLNTEFDESDLVFINADTCVFASNRPGGKGGLDLYRANYNYKSQIDFDDSEFNLSLSSTIYLVRIESEINIDYRYDVDSKSFIKAANVVKKYFPEELELQFLAKPNGIMASGFVQFIVNENLVYTYNLNNTVENFSVKLSEILANTNSNYQTMIVRGSVITRGNFEVEKQIEINFTEKEILNNRPFKLFGNSYSRLSILSVDADDDSIASIIKILSEESATDIYIKIPSILDVKATKLISKLKNSYPNSKILDIATEAIDNVYIEVYFR